MLAMATHACIRTAVGQQRRKGDMVKLALVLHVQDSNELPLQQHICRHATSVSIRLHQCGRAESLHAHSAAADLDYRHECIRRCGSTGFLPTLETVSQAYLWIVWVE